MAKLECALSGDFRGILVRIEEGILSGSVSATLEASTDWTEGDARCSVRVFERFSWLGNNRVSMNVTLLGVGNRVRVSAITSGGSQALFFKINTFGEQAFLDCLENVLRKNCGWNGETEPS